MKSKPIVQRFSLRRDRLTTTMIKTRRCFDLKMAMPPYEDLVLDVLNSIENSRLKVVDETSGAALHDVINDGQVISLSAAFTKSASIRRWLAAGCQFIRWEIGDEFGEQNRKRGVMAMYRHNAGQVLFPVGSNTRPAGPAAFVGEIIVNTDCFAPDAKATEAKAFQFVLAHELTHVFDTLSFLIPALRNWPSFWRNFLADGQNCHWAMQFNRWQGVFVDDYGSKNELATVSEYWPSRAEEWFTALRGK